MRPFVAQGTKRDCKIDWLWVQSPLEEIKYLLRFIFSFIYLVSRHSAALSPAIQHAMPPELGGTECLNSVSVAHCRTLTGRLAVVAVVAVVAAQRDVDGGPGQQAAAAARVVAALLQRRAVRGARQAAVACGHTSRLGAQFN